MAIPLVRGPAASAAAPGSAYFRKYHWPMHAWALPDEVLKKIYRENALAADLFFPL